MVSPAEPDARVKALGRVSSLPERFGCDLLWVAGGKKFGVQRKEVADLRASVEDGRLGKELGQMRQGGVRGLVVIEGRVTFTPDGTLLDGGFGRPWNRAGWWGVQFAIQLEGAWCMTTASVVETCAATEAFKKWTEKDRHSGLHARPGPTGLWGSKANDADWGKHVLTGFPGIGPELAGRMFNMGGRVPLEWTMTEEEMMRVEGLGKKRVGALRRVLS